MKNLESRNLWIMKAMMGLTYDENLYELSEHEQVKLFEHMAEIDKLFKNKVKRYFYCVSLDEILVREISINEKESYTSLDSSEVGDLGHHLDNMFEVTHKWVETKDNIYLSIWYCVEDNQHYVGLNFCQHEADDMFISPDKNFSRFVFNNLDYTEFTNLDGDINKLAKHWLELIALPVEELAVMVNVWI